MLKVKLFIVSWFLTVSLNAQAINRKQKAIQQTVENMFATLSTFDTLALKGFLTANVRFYEYGQIWNMDTIIQKAMLGKRVKDFNRTNSFVFVNTIIHQKTAWVTYYLQSIITRDNKQETLHWMETVILVKDKRKWKIEVLHSTRLNSK